jgi:hypothetical protein
MMNIRKLNHVHHKIAFIKPWYFLVPAIIFALMAISGLRQNYATMIELREAVYTVDQENGDIEAALKELREHVHNHMNTNLSSGSNAIKPPIQLKARYERLVAANKAAISNQNAQVTARGESICAARYPAGGFNAPRVECIQEYVRTNAVVEQPVPDQLYKFDFISPRWSPDLAGNSIVISALFFILFFGRIGLEFYMRKRLS